MRDIRGQPSKPLTIYPSFPKLSIERWEIGFFIGGVHAEVMKLGDIREDAVVERITEEFAEAFFIFFMNLVGRR